MSDERDNHEAGSARGQAPATARPGIAPPPKPAGARLGPPPSFAPPKRAGAAESSVGAAAAARSAPVVAPASKASLGPPPKPPIKASGGATPGKAPGAAIGATPGKAGGAVIGTTPIKPGGGPSEATPGKPPGAAIGAPQGKAGGAMIGTTPIKPGGGPSEATPGKGSGAADGPTLGALGLPPPPEFLPRAGSAELPLENWVGDVSEELSGHTLPGIPPLRIDEAPGVIAEDEREASRKLDLRDLAQMLPRVLEPAPSVDPGERDGMDEAAPAEADEGVDVDIDVSEDTLPRIPIVLPAREPYPALPAQSQVPTAPVPVVKLGPMRSAEPIASAVPVASATRIGSGSLVARSGALGSVAPAEPRNRTARLLEARVPPPSRPLGLWIAVGAAVGAVLSILALLWISASGSEKEASPGSTGTPAVEAKAGTTPTPAPEVPEAKEAKAEAPPAPAPNEADAKAEPAPAPVPAPEPEEPSVEVVADEPPSETSVITVERDRSDYELALAEFRKSGSQKSLLDMTTAACALDDGPRARWAFRQLVGRTLRTKAMVACQEARVDVTATVDGYTGPELLAQARAALEAGDAKTALDKAHQSNKVERSSDAVLIKGLAACKLGDGGHAQRLLPHVSIKSRSRLVEGCKAAGIELRD